MEYAGAEVLHNGSMLGSSVDGFAMLDFGSPTTKKLLRFPDHAQRPAGSTTSTMPLGSKYASKP